MYKKEIELKQIFTTTTRDIFNKFQAQKLKHGQENSNFWIDFLLYFQATAAGCYLVLLMYLVF